jgi:primosomal protein N' (replication factor Y)
MTAAPAVVQVALPCPLDKLFDYLAPAGATVPPVGVRVRVPFGARRTLVGVVAGRVPASQLPPQRLKRIAAVLDAEPLWSDELFGLLRWAADYYHHPLGEVVATALPTLLRQGRPAQVAGVSQWYVTADGRGASTGALGRAPLRHRLLEALRAAPDGLSEVELRTLSPNWPAAMRALREKGWAQDRARNCLEPASVAALPGPALSTAQQAALDAILGAAAGYHCHVLHGVTGSGKTEVYLRVIEQVLARGEQALVLVPEIGLTPQLVSRFRARFPVPIAVLHSGLTDQERLCAWLAAREGHAPIVLGTRSAVFAPFRRLGVIVVDEEHDASYKQQEGFRYSARDLTVARAARERIPVVLGSATPALETLKNARDGAYALIELPDRAGAAALPVVRLLDMRRLKPADGLSAPLREALAQRLARAEQSLLFLNRRGFAPVWMCHDCGWVAACRRCDARLVLHEGSRQLRCHHCGAEEPLAPRCPSCSGNALRPLGEGTERVESALQRLFPEARIERIDRDSTRRKGTLEEKLARAERGEADILVGTQMLAKGHDFPNVTLVGVVNADQGLYSADFRAPERLIQQILQVAGRAGRADKPGEVLIQTWHPQHPLFAALQHHNFHEFADFALAERQAAALPPYSHLALLRAESTRSGEALRFLQAARACAPPGAQGLQLFDPVASPMERRAGRHRAQLLIQAGQRRPLHAFLRDWLPEVGALPLAKRVRWSLDVDPIDLF